MLYLLIMKKAFTTWYNYIFTIIGLGIVSTVAIVPYFGLNDSTKWPTSYISYVYLFGGVILFGVGFIWQDLYRGLIRKRINNWETNLPQEYVDKAWRIFHPFFTSGILSVLTGIIQLVLFKF